MIILTVLLHVDVPLLLRSEWFPGPPRLRALSPHLAQAVVAYRSVFPHHPQKGSLPLFHGNFEGGASSINKCVSLPALSNLIEDGFFTLPSREMNVYEEIEEGEG